MSAPEPPRNPGRLGARELARAKREAMARRAKRIRTWVAVAAVSMFIAAFMVVYVQLASGHDPALTTNAKRGAVRSSGASGGEASSSAAETGGESSESSESETGAENPEAESSTSESGSSGSEAESSGPSELTTSQS